MSAFGEVQYEAGSSPSDASPTTTTTQHGANGATKSEHEIVDLNDPRLMSEQLSENPAGDAYALPPPLPAGKWRSKAKQVDIKDDKQNLQRFAAFVRAKMNGGKPFLATNVEFTVLESSGKWDGTKLTEYWVKTVVEQRSGTSQIATLLAKFKQPVVPATPGARMEQFLKVLAGEPEIVIETDWEASCMQCQEIAKKKGEKQPRPFMLGMHRFPQVKIQGIMQHDPVVKCPEGHQVRAQARIVQFHSLETPHNK